MTRRVTAHIHWANGSLSECSNFPTERKRLMKSFVKAGAIAAAGAAAMMSAAGAASAHDNGASAEGVAAHSPGALSGNAVQVPVSVPINLCGNSVDIVGLLNPAFGNVCVNH